MVVLRDFSALRVVFGLHYDRQMAADELIRRSRHFGRLVEATPSRLHVESRFTTGA